MNKPLRVSLPPSPRKGIIAMIAPDIVGPAGVLDQALGQASPDLMRSLLQTMVNALLSADVDAVCGAEYGQASPEHRAQHNGYRHRDLDTRVGTIDVAVPKLRTGSYFPDWLLERRKRAESALITVLADAYLAGVCTRHMDKLVGALGVSSLSKSQVSRMAAELDEHVASFRNRPLGDAGPLHLRGGRRPDNEGPSRRSRGQCGGPDGHWGQRRRTSRGPGPAGSHLRERSSVERVPRRPGCPRPGRGPAGHF